MSYVVCSDQVLNFTGGSILIMDPVKQDSKIECVANGFGDPDVSKASLSVYDGNFTFISDHV